MLSFPMPASSYREEDPSLFELNRLNKPIDKYLFLRKLYEEDSDDYYRLMMENTELVLPFIYTPTVGEACQKYHILPGIKTRGLYISLKDKGRILDKLKSWPQQAVRVVVVTDGERILGLGDLGTGGMGISEGKITLYTVAAGVDPTLCLPVCLDMGTNNKALLEDPSYPGLRQPRASVEEYNEVLDEFMEALQRWQQHILLQFEDFGNNNAFRLLERYSGHHCCFNDDIQGTAAITLAAVLAAVKATGSPLGEQRVLFLGAGEAGTGIGELIAYCIHRTTGLSRQEARGRCFFMDSKGLVCASRRDELAHHKLPFAHDMPHVKQLIEAVHTIKPTALIGVSTIAGAFNEEVVKAMCSYNKHPIIFPLSNPTSKSECTFEQAFKWSDGRVIFASGSPFDPIPIDKPGYGKGSVWDLASHVAKDLTAQEHHRGSSRDLMAGYRRSPSPTKLHHAAGAAATSASPFSSDQAQQDAHHHQHHQDQQQQQQKDKDMPRMVYPSQANNAYIFPAVGLAAILTRASHLTDEVFLVAAQALSDLAEPDEVLSHGVLFPPFRQILDVSAHVTALLCEHLVSSGAGLRPHECPPGRDAQDTYDIWRSYVESCMWRAPGPVSRKASMVQALPPPDSPAALVSPRQSAGGAAGVPVLAGSPVHRASSRM